MLYIGHSGGRHIGFIDVESGEIFAEEGVFLTASHKGSKWQITAQYLLEDHLLFVGTADRDHNPKHSGSGRLQFTLMELSVSDVLPKGSRPALTVVDVGAAGGIEPAWSRFVNDVHFILIEPGPEAAKRLQSETARIPHCTIVEKGLAGRDGVRRLNLTKAPVCSSLLEPDSEVLKRFAIAPIFEVVEQLDVSCFRYDSLLAEGLPAPDYIKLDTQGTELEILTGFGELLWGCAGIVLEAHLYPIYKDQALLGDVVAFLDRYDLALREARPCRTFDDELLEVDCVFTRRLSHSTDSVMRAKVEFVEEALSLQRFSVGANIAREFSQAGSGAG